MINDIWNIIKNLLKYYGLLYLAIILIFVVDIMICILPIPTILKIILCVAFDIWVSVGFLNKKFKKIQDDFKNDLKK